MRHIGRKLYHLLGGIALLSLYYVLGRDHALLFYGAFFLLVLFLDITRLAVPSVNEFIYSRFSGIIRANEKSKLTGTPPYVFGIGASLYLYSAETATAAICFLAFGDVAATAVGERYGKTKIGDKSLEGTAGFLFASFGVSIFLSLLGLGPALWVMAIGAVVASGAELIALPVNDNLSIPLIAGGIMTLLQKLFL